MRKGSYRAVSTSSPCQTAAWCCQGVMAFSFEYQGLFERIEIVSEFCLGLDRMYFFLLYWKQVAPCLPSWLLHFSLPVFSIHRKIYFFSSHLCFDPSKFLILFCTCAFSWSHISSGKPSKSAQAPVTKHHGLRSLSNSPLSVLETGRARTSCRQICCLVRALFLACRQQPSLQVLTWPFLQQVHVEAESNVLFLFV